jgi:acetate kinase
MNDPCQIPQGAADAMDAPAGCILVLNGGSSSIKFGLFGDSRALGRILSGRIERIGMPDGRFTAKGVDPAYDLERPIAVPDHLAAVGALLDWIRERIEPGRIQAVGHRIAHGGDKFWRAQRVTPDLLKELRHLTPFDPEHLPEEILLVEAFTRAFPDLPQIACFDSGFHHGMPRVAQRIAIPRRYEAMGVRRYGSHGLSCAYLMEELARVASPFDAQGRVVLAHLGNCASLTAVRGGKSLDTSMGFSCTSGIPMGTRSGDLDPSLAWYMARTEEMSARQFHQMVNLDSGLLGISETTSDMVELLAREADDLRAAEAVETFCYQVRKQICSMAGVLEGLDTLVFSGGIGQNSAPIRSRICQGMGFLGIDLDPKRNEANAPQISTGEKPVSVRVVATDEEWMIARTVLRVMIQDAPRTDLS